jgi:hypothetical protein
VKIRRERDAFVVVVITFGSTTLHRLQPVLGVKRTNCECVQRARLSQSLHLLFIASVVVVVVVVFHKMSSTVFFYRFLMAFRIWLQKNSHHNTQDTTNNSYNRITQQESLRRPLVFVFVFVVVALTYYDNQY